MHSTSLTARHEQPKPHRQRVVVNHSEYSQGGSDDGEDSEQEDDDNDDVSHWSGRFDVEELLGLGLARYTEKGIKILCLPCLEDGVEQLKKQVQELEAELKKKSKDHKKQFEALEAKHAKDKDELLKQVNKKSASHPPASEVDISLPQLLEHQLPQVQVGNLQLVEAVQGHHAHAGDGQAHGVGNRVQVQPEEDEEKIEQRRRRGRHGVRCRQPAQDEA